MLGHRPVSLSRRGGLSPRRRYVRGPRRRALGIWVYAGLFGASAALFALDITHHRIAHDTRQVVTDLAAPVLGAASGTVRIAKLWINEARSFADLNSEVGVLRDENRALRDWQRRARELEGRAKRYEALLNMQPDPGIDMITARAIADTRTPFSRSLIINAGHEAGVVEGNAVLGTEGFIGRVVSTGAQSARVLLINDLESRIPVYVGAGRHRSILAGTNSDEPTLLYVPAGAKLHDGDVVITSGEGQLLPAGMPVGDVRLGGDGTFSVVPASSPASVEFVRVIDYRVSVDVADGMPPLPALFAERPQIADATLADANLADANLVDANVIEASAVASNEVSGSLVPVR